MHSSRQLALLPGTHSKSLQLPVAARALYGDALQLARLRVQRDQHLAPRVPHAQPADAQVLREEIALWTQLREARSQVDRVHPHARGQSHPQAARGVVPSRQRGGVPRRQQIAIVHVRELGGVVAERRARDRGAHRVEQVHPAPVIGGRVLRRQLRHGRSGLGWRFGLGRGFGSSSRLPLARARWLRRGSPAARARLRPAPAWPPPSSPPEQPASATTNSHEVTDPDHDALIMSRTIHHRRGALKGCVHGVSDGDGRSGTVCELAMAPRRRRRDDALRPRPA